MVNPAGFNPGQYGKSASGFNEDQRIFPTSVHEKSSLLSENIHERGIHNLPPSTITSKCLDYVQSGLASTGQFIIKAGLRVGIAAALPLIIGGGAVGLVHFIQTWGREEGLIAGARAGCFVAQALIFPFCFIGSSLVALGEKDMSIMDRFSKVVTTTGSSICDLSKFYGL